MRRLLRVLIGFSMACLAASATALVFAALHAELFALPWDAVVDRIAWIADMSWKLAIVFAMVAGLPAAAASAIGERRTIRRLRFYVLAGIGIALVGYGAQAGRAAMLMPPVIVAFTALAYTMTGLVAGVVYWGIAGRLAGELEERVPVKTVWLARAARGRLDRPSP